MYEKKTIAAPLKMPLTPRGTKQQQQKHMCILCHMEVCDSPMKTIAAPLKMPLTPGAKNSNSKRNMCILRHMEVCDSPMYEKKTIAAPLKMPLTPKGVKGWMLAGLDLTKPACGQKITEITL
jgi:hypothetical protein